MNDRDNIHSNRQHIHRKNISLIGLSLMGEGVAMLGCIVPAVHYGDGTWWQILVAAVLTVVFGMVMRRSHIERFIIRMTGNQTARSSYVVVALVWLMMTLFGTLPFLMTGSSASFADAFFESMSGLTSTGATVFGDVEMLPPSVLLWRSLSQWFGGFGIILLVLAIVPRMGLNKYSLYTAEASGADNTGKTTTSVRATVQHTLFVYVTLTVLFVVLLSATGMTLWEAVNLTFTNISTGGFSIYADSVARFTPTQQYILAASMFVGGVNFALLYNILTFRWKKIRHKLDQFGFYVALIAVSVVFVSIVLKEVEGYDVADAIRCAVVQTVSVLTTTGSVVADTNQWWTPVEFLFLVLCFCGGMAGSTTGGVKIMRVLILLRDVRNGLVNRLHPHAYNPVRLNGKPVAKEIITNVKVIYVVFAVTMIVSLMLLMLCGVGATESLGAVFGCITGYGPGLGECGGFGSYASFPVSAKWVCSMLMLLGRLECLTILIILLPGFWRNR